MYFLLNMILMLLLILCVLVGVAFVTLLERKILGYIQDRKGPNKVGFIGVMQPFSDAIKLFTKEVMIIMKSNFYLYLLCPLFLLMLMIIIWVSFPIFTNIYFMNYSILLMIVIMSLSSYVLMLIGWVSNSVYSMVGCLRSIAQMLSYEVSFIMIILIIMVLSESYSVIDFFNWQLYVKNMVLLFPVFVVFFISVLAELNRSPVDLIEGESELVSGFNIEYSSGGFALIFMAEYGMIVFFSLMMVFMFIGMSGAVANMFFMNLFIMMIIFMRGMLPRMRYDELMYLCWKIILPLILNYLMLFLSFKCGLSVIC